MVRQENFCEVCGLTFDTDEELNRHMLSAHDIEVEDDDSADEGTAA